jgi:pyroglutamyl-peptidase
MTSVLITAFRPYAPWLANASWLALVEMTKDLPPEPQVTTRLYPVEFAALRERLEEDLEENYDVVLHLGQAPGAAEIRLEAIGLNVGEDSGENPHRFFALAEDGPLAYRSRLPLDTWARDLRAAGLPAVVSHHAGIYLCNAALYWTHHILAQRGRSTRVGFMHVPLDPSQLDGDAKTPSLPAIASASALRFVLEHIHRNSPA